MSSKEFSNGPAFLPERLSVQQIEQLDVYHRIEVATRLSAAHEFLSEVLGNHPRQEVRDAMTVLAQEVNAYMNSLDEETKARIRATTHDVIDENEEHTPRMGYQAMAEDLGRVARDTAQGKKRELGEEGE